MLGYIWLVHNRTILATTLGIAIGLVCVLQIANLVSVNTLNSEVNKMTNGDAQQDPGGQTLEHGPWMWNGIPVKVVTTRNPGESVDAFTVRHNEVVVKALDKWPKDT